MAGRLRMLHGEDAAGAAELDRLAYGREATAASFAAELGERPAARYVGLEDAAGKLVGMAGSWYVLDEAHVITVAVAPELRGQGYGRLLLHALLDLAMQYGMNVATLEVRPSNASAQRLYRVYGFHEVGWRRAYYGDSGEDAVIMTTEELREGPYQARFRELTRVIEERLPGYLPMARLPSDLREPGE